MRRPRDDDAKFQIFVTSMLLRSASVRMPFFSSSSTCAAMAAMLSARLRSSCCMAVCIAVPRSIGVRCSRSDARRKRGISHSGCMLSAFPTAGRNGAITSSSTACCRFSSVLAWICAVPRRSYVQSSTAATRSAVPPSGRGLSARTAERTASVASCSSV